MKKLFKEIEEQYVYLWWWLLEQGLIIATLLVGSFMIVIFTICMSIIYLFLKWYAKHLH